MESLDLDINNYNLNDILRLFKLSINLQENDMKKAKKMVLMTHPDKSRLSPDVFLFYSKAYKILYYVYKFRKQGGNKSTDYQSYIEDVKRDISEEDKIKKFTKSNVFNKKFNEIFESNKMNDDENDKGYNEWFRSEEGLNNTKASNITQMNTIIEMKKKEARELIVNNDYSPLGGTSSYDLTREALENYSSDIFSKLQFEDLKKAHSETVIPVSEEDVLNRPQYENMMDLKISREKDNVKPMNNNEVQLFLKKQEEKNMQIGSNTAFRLAQQSQEASKINNNISRHFNRILN
tara:strand:+ start:240 stop:1115 length:876 start_codon:yes stop_codon:yes gene_type:complete